MNNQKKAHTIAVLIYFLICFLFFGVILAIVIGIVSLIKHDGSWFFEHWVIICMINLILTIGSMRSNRSAIKNLERAILDRIDGMNMRI